MDKQELKSLLEALLFTSNEPLTLDHFVSVIPETDKDILMEILQEMSQEYQSREAGIVLREVAGGYQFYSNPRWHSEVQALFSKPLVVRLSRSALETLAVVAYKQPITLPEISEIRSCNAAGAIKTLLELNFIKVLGSEFDNIRRLVRSKSNNYQAEQERKNKGLHLLNWRMRKKENSA